MTRNITYEISFIIVCRFEEWVKIFDSKEADLRYSEFDIKTLFRSFIKNYQKKVIWINQATEGNIQNFVQSNNVLIKSHKVDFSTMEVSSLI